MFADDWSGYMRLLTADCNPRKKRIDQERSTRFNSRTTTISCSFNLDARTYCLFLINDLPLDHTTINKCYPVNLPEIAISLSYIIGS